MSWLDRMEEETRSQTLGRSLRVEAKRLEGCANDRGLTIVGWRSNLTVEAVWGNLIRIITD
ncbi:hypothetical protein BH20CHL3_BH20CHL3_07970 [soil metagenome]